MNVFYVIYIFVYICCDRKKQTSCQQGLRPPNFDGKRLSAINLLQLNLKTIDDIVMVRLSSIVEILRLGFDKGYGHQIWAAETARDYYSVKTVKPYDYCSLVNQNSL